MTLWLLLINDQFNWFSICQDNWFKWLWIRLLSIVLVVIIIVVIILITWNIVVIVPISIPVVIISFVRRRIPIPCLFVWVVKLIFSPSMITMAVRLQDRMAVNWWICLLLGNWILFWSIFNPFNMIWFLPLVFCPGILSVWMFLRTFLSYCIFLWGIFNPLNMVWFLPFIFIPCIFSVRMLFLTFLSNWVFFWSIFYPLTFICLLMLTFVPSIFSIRMILLTFLSYWIFLWSIFYPLDMIRFLPFIFSPSILSVWMLLWAFLSNYIFFWGISFPLNFVCLLLFTFCPCFFSVWMFILTFLSDRVLLWLIFYPLNMVGFLPLFFSPGIFSIWVLFRLFFILSSASLAFFYISFWLWLNLRQGFWLPQVRSSSHDLIIGYWIDIVWVKYFFEILLFLFISFNFISENRIFFKVDIQILIRNGECRFLMVRLMRQMKSISSHSFSFIFEIVLLWAEIFLDSIIKFNMLNVARWTIFEISFDTANIFQMLILPVKFRKQTLVVFQFQSKLDCLWDWKSSKEY